ncbi:MAG: esterase-like activity of phytase family protein [Xanthobacteraceae bacterium]|nr:esterase-like activity of phytase family protein [Xanthobacteraceae bacterium]QYK44734.1 MAG: esterase-like activity of phytase family protein [Xanthobacteraceae bacterium]
MRTPFRYGGLALASIMLLATGPSAPKAQRSLSPIAVTVEAKEIAAFDPANPSKQRFGSLVFRGGLVLTAKERFFGGFSGLHIFPNGENFIAHSDRGMWLRGKFKRDGDRIAGIENAEMAPMRGPNGKPLASLGWFDTESLTADGDTLYVGIERANQIVRFRYGAEGLGALGIPLNVPNGIRELPHNQGLEALAFVPKGMPLAGGLLALSERGLDENGNIKAFILGGATPGSFSVKRSNNFEISDAAIAPSGHLILLERYFTFLSGIHMRIRAIPLGEIKPGALADGRVLIEAGPSYEIDNMEALAITRNEKGETIFTLLSDNNFNGFQRTILLRFAWIEP